MLYTRKKILIAAAAVGLITAALLYFQYFARVGGRAGNVEVVVASTFISANTIISPDMVRLKSIPQSDARPDVANRISQVNQKVTTEPIEEGEQIVLPRLVDKSAVYGLAAIVPPGTIAMTIMVDSADAVAGFLHPGDHVDVVASITDRDETVARTILQNIVLLGVNSSFGATPRPTATTEQQTQQPAQQPTSGQQQQPTQVTVAVAPAEAERLVAAQYKGKLKLGLRGLNDSSRAATTGVSVSGIFGLRPPQEPRAARPSVTVTPAPAAAAKAPRKVAKAPAAQPQRVAPFLPPIAGPLETAPSAGPTIRVIKGGQVQEVQVGH